MIEAILPSQVIAVEARTDEANDDAIKLFPEEEAALGQAIDKRRREFTTARACARKAFSRLGVPAVAITNGPRGEPRWPAGVVGSMTHCDGYRACAIAQATDMITIGIDAEPHHSLPEGVLPEIAGPQELSWLDRLGREVPSVHWDRLLFSAKESVYKAWFPLAKRWLGFEDALVTVNPSTRAFTARLLVPGPVLPEGDGQLAGFTGQWLIGDGLVLTAIALPSPRPA
jgi:4'-phosphopantetheinyl transferase EntD